jgi:transcriptional regulator with XRE-family HTH domain
MVSGRTPDWERRRQVVELRAQGLTMKEIGRRLGVTQQAVSCLLKNTPPRVLPDVCCRVCGVWVADLRVAPRGEENALCLACLGNEPFTPAGQRLKAFRLAAGLTFVELAARAGIAPDKVRRYERGRQKPSSATRVKLANALGISPAELWRGAQASLAATAGPGVPQFWTIAPENSASPQRPRIPAHVEHYPISFPTGVSHPSLPGGRPCPEVRRPG